VFSAGDRRNFLGNLFGVFRITPEAISTVTNVIVGLGWATERQDGGVVLAIMPRGAMNPNRRRTTNCMKSVYFQHSRGICACVAGFSDIPFERACRRSAARSRTSKPDQQSEETDPHSRKMHPRVIEDIRWAQTIRGAELFFSSVGPRKPSATQGRDGD